MDGREVLERGLIRWIGTGETTNIWHTNYLPREGLLHPLWSIKANAPQLLSELIDSTTEMWDANKLHEFFTPTDVKVIKSMPLSTRRQ
jgi:hypothetical protein